MTTIESVTSYILVIYVFVYLFIGLKQLKIKRILSSFNKKQLQHIVASNSCIQRPTLTGEMCLTKTTTNDKPFHSQCRALKWLRQGGEFLDS